MNGAFIQILKVTNFPRYKTNSPLGYRAYVKIMPKEEGSFGNLNLIQQNVDNNTENGGQIKKKEYLTSSVTWNYQYEDASVTSLGFSFFYDEQNFAILKLPLSWFQKNTVVTYTYPAMLLLQIPKAKKIMVKIAIHLSENNEAAFAAPKGKLLVAPAWNLSGKKKHIQASEQQHNSPEQQQIHQQQQMPNLNVNTPNAAIQGSIAQQHVNKSLPLQETSSVPDVEIGSEMQQHIQVQEPTPLNPYETSNQNLSQTETSEIHHQNQSPSQEAPIRAKQQQLNNTNHHLNDFNSDEEPLDNLEAAQQEQSDSSGSQDIQQNNLHREPLSKQLSTQHQSNQLPPQQQLPPPQQLPPQQSPPQQLPPQQLPPQQLPPQQLPPQQLPPQQLPPQQLPPQQLPPQQLPQYSYPPAQPPSSYYPYQPQMPYLPYPPQPQGAPNAIPAVFQPNKQIPQPPQSFLQPLPPQYQQPLPPPQSSSRQQPSQPPKTQQQPLQSPSQSLPPQIPPPPPQYPYQYPIQYQPYQYGYPYPQPVSFLPQQYQYQYQYPYPYQLFYPYQIPPPTPPNLPPQQQQQQQHRNVIYIQQDSPIQQSQQLPPHLKNNQQQPQKVPSKTQTANLYPAQYQTYAKSNSNQQKQYEIPSIPPNTPQKVVIPPPVTFEPSKETEQQLRAQKQQQQQTEKKKLKLKEKNSRIKKAQQLEGGQISSQISVDPSQESTSMLDQSSGPVLDDANGLGFVDGNAPKVEQPQAQTNQEQKQEKTAQMEIEKKKLSQKEKSKKIRKAQQLNNVGSLQMSVDTSAESTSMLEQNGGQQLDDENGLGFVDANNEKKQEENAQVNNGEKM